MDDLKLDVNNDINVVIKTKNDGILFDQDCCTVINLILNNEGEIATSFLGVHNEFIIKQLFRAQKAYLKSLKKALKAEAKQAKTILDDDENKSAEENDKETTATKEVETGTKPAEHQCTKKGKSLYKKQKNSTTQKK